MAGKNDAVARRIWGKAYDDVPKSVLAVLAFYLAERISDGQGIEICLEELSALSDQITDKRQTDAAIRAICREFGVKEGPC